MATEGNFPKTDGDIFYASELNNIVNLTYFNGSPSLSASAGSGSTDEQSVDFGEVASSTNFVSNKNYAVIILHFTSSANDDIVVKEPQNPIAKKKEYLGSSFQVIDRIENAPKRKLPIILTIKTFSVSPPNTIGYSTILYRKKAPQSAPIPIRTNSNPFITKVHILRLMNVTISNNLYLLYDRIII